MTIITILLIGTSSAVIILIISAYYAYKCDNLCYAYDVRRGIFEPNWKNTHTLWNEFHQRGVRFSPKDFQKFLNKLVETGQIEIDTDTNPKVPWYRLRQDPRKVETKQPRLYDPNVTD